MRKILLFLVLLASISLASQIRDDPPYDPPTPDPPPFASLTSSAVFSPSMVGQTWVFRNNACDPICDLTYVSIEAPPSSNRFSSNCVVWHYVKTRGRAYWLPGVVGSELRFVICPEADKSWSSVASVMHGSTDSAGNGSPWGLTADIQPAPNQPLGYIVIPAYGDNASVGQLVTSYLGYGALGIETFDSIISSPPPTISPTSWRTDSYVTNICVPFQGFCGPVLVSEQWENCNTSTWDGVGCVHERWYLAPNAGLVKVDVLNIGNGEGHGFCTNDLGMNRCYSLSDISITRTQ